jgi:RNA polymerase sigma-70 factor (ECF subfamily)
MKQQNSFLPQDLLYQQALAAHESELIRVAAGYERDPAKRPDLLQDIHLAIWRSMAVFKEQCSLRTWVYRVAHNVGATHVQRNLRPAERNHTDLDALAWHIDESTDVAWSDRQLDLARVMQFIHSLGPLDREVMLLYLEGIDAATSSDITGLSVQNIATKIHRIKHLLNNMFNSGVNHHE